jgi:ADP-ribose pyrophosphatase YjhB (NUDIX family)
MKKTYFTKDFWNGSSFDFIKTDELPPRELVTCVFALVHEKWKLHLTKNHRWWELPWGHIEKWENFGEALEREMAEEIGTWIKNPVLFWYKRYSNTQWTPNREGGFYPFPHSYILLYICESNGVENKTHCPDTLDFGLFSLEEALNKIKSSSTSDITKVLYTEMEMKQK